MPPKKCGDLVPSFCDKAIDEKWHDRQTFNDSYAELTTKSYLYGDLDGELNLFLNDNKKQMKMSYL
jgi:hypothetical protein